MPEPHEVATRLRAAFTAGDPVLFASLLDPWVRWGGEDETPQTCHSRGDVLAWYGRAQAAGVRAQVTETLVRERPVVLGLALTGPGQGSDGERPDQVFQTFRLADGLIIDIRGYPTREEALAVADTTASPA
ncbi:nuclear transport factor 2 family protein [Streptomyces sp. NPDC054783]